MMNQSLKLMALVLALMLGMNANAQQYLLAGSSKMEIKGTSSLHDWESAVEGMEGLISMDGSNIKKLVLTIDVMSIKSGISSIMDKNTYRALKYNDGYHEITFVSEDISMNGTEFTAKGNLSIAGTKKYTTVEGECTVLSDGGLNCKGEKKLKMTDYGVEPPTALMGTITTGDEVRISFDATFK
ncbi:MAG: YceI family protein [Chitinophagales bacterium]|nr:YceI family protein [Bacteroidota bacterium]MCB9042800.1 YceI family protein [Chitinophagales bacterium]